MAIAIVMNPKAGSAEANAALLEQLAARSDVEVLKSESNEELIRLVREAATGGKYRVVAVAGGDGTVHAAVNALAPKFPHTPLAIIPLGTGNDLCRSLDVPLDPGEAVKLLDRPRVRRIDVVRVEGAEHPFLVNAATGGFSGKVATDVTSELKCFWGPLAYLRGAVGAVADPPTYKLMLRFDGGEPVEMTALNIVVANARTAAGGVVVAPKADLEDGRLDVIVVRPGSFADHTVITARLMAGEYDKDELVWHRRARRVEIESYGPIPFSIDGEVVEGRRFAFESLRQALPVVVGRGYRRFPGGRWKTLGHRLMGGVAGVVDAGTRMFRGDRAGTALVALAVILFSLLAVGVVQGRWAEENEAVLRRLRANATPELDSFAQTLTRFGGWLEATVIAAAAGAVMVLRKRYANAATLLAIVAGCAMLEVVLKGVFAVARPDAELRIVAAEWYSFPSGHAVRGVGLYGGIAGLLIVAKPRSWVRWVVGFLLLVLAVGICWTRVYLAVHWVTDVVAGAAAAAAWVGCCLLARYRILRRRALPRHETG